MTSTMHPRKLPPTIADIDGWYKSEISRWRSGAALVWTIVLTGPVVYGILGVARINVFHPITWLVESLLHVLSPWTWMYQLIIIVMVAVLTIQNAKQQTVVPVVFHNRWEKISSVLCLSCIWSMIVCGVVCAGIAWCYARLVGEPYTRLSAPCEENSTQFCLNEHHLCVVIHSLYIGVVYRLTTVLSGRTHMVFPIVQQSKFFQLKGSAISMVWSSVLMTLNRLKYFIIIYYVILGNTIKNLISTNLGLVQRSTDVPVDSIAGLLDLSLWWHCILCGAMIHYLLTLGTRIHKLYQTEWFQFTVETPIEQYQNLCLHNALRCKHNSLVQYHGYQDLYLLSKHSLSRRLQVFSLTQLGGHPENWIQVSNESLQLVHTFIENISAYNTNMMNTGSMKQPTTEKTAITGDARQRLFSGKESLPAGWTPGNPSFIKVLIEDLKKNRIIAYFIAQDHDARSRQLFAKAQLYIWAIEAISYLVCASFEEDKFGVVQKSLPDIMATLLALHEQIEKHFRLVPNIGKRSDREDNKNSDAALRGALKVTLKVAIYRVVSKFGKHLRSVPLSSEHMRRLNHFMEFKE